MLEGAYARCGSFYGYIVLDKVDWSNRALMLETAFPFNTNETYFKAILMFLVMTFTALDPSFLHRLILARDKEQAVYVTNITGYLSLVLFTFMGFLGVSLSMMNVSIDSAIALPYIIDQFAPSVLKGIIVSSLLATIMSTADSGLHVVSCSVVRDLIVPFKKSLGPFVQLRLARLVTLLIGTVSVVIAVCFKNIFDIMIFAFGLWAPTGLIPLLFVLFGVKTSKKQLVFGCFSSFVLTTFWNSVLKDYLYVDGLIPGSLYAILCFFGMGFYNRKNTAHA